MNASAEVSTEINALVDIHVHVPCFVHSDRRAEWRLTVRCVRTISITLCNECQADLVTDERSVKDHCDSPGHRWSDVPRIMSLSSL